MEVSVMADKKGWIDKIVELEWKQFQQVNNEGGRAPCQEDRETFDIMRRSQFLAWEEMVLESYWKDLVDAEARGWNMIQEKYMRMMKYTAPKQYAAFAEILPQQDEVRRILQNYIINKEIQWAEATARKFPKVSAGGRKIHAEEDTPWETSMETYLRGELETYSDKTLVLYRNMLNRMDDAGENMVELTLQYTAKLYGYGSLEEAEENKNK